MDANGKMHNVLIENIFYTDHQTGLKKSVEREIIVYFDKGYENQIADIPCVLDVRNYGNTKYYISLDPRYDEEYAKKEIEAILTVLSE